MVEWQCGGRRYWYLTGMDEVRDNPRVRQSFCRLAAETFEIDFESWYRHGYWGEGFQPHLLWDGERVVSNLSANPMRIQYPGGESLCLQLGTVMTVPDSRNRGLCRRLMERVLEDWQGRCEQVFLYANDSVLGFYPKFGFEPAVEYEAFWRPDCGVGAASRTARRQLSADRPEDLELLYRLARRGNPFSQVRVASNENVVMFYAMSVLREGIWYLPEWDAAVLMEARSQGEACVWEILGGEAASLKTLLMAVADAGTRELTLGFDPLDQGMLERRVVREEDCTLFRLGGHTGWAEGRRTRLPLTAHT